MSDNAFQSPLSVDKPVGDISPQDLAALQKLQKRAKASWQLPLAAWGLAIVLRIASGVAHVQFSGFSGIAVLVCVIVGLALSIGALITRKGRPGIFVHALIGLILNGGIIALIIYSIMVVIYGPLLRN